jgi:hypothetical protein
MENTMNKILFAFLFAFTTVSFAADKAPETKKVCVDQKQKDGKSKQVCKDVKIHKKLEGTQVPPAKK